MQVDCLRKGKDYLQARELGNALKKLLTFFKSVNMANPGVNIYRRWQQGKGKELFCFVLLFVSASFAKMNTQPGYMIIPSQQPCEYAVFLFYINQTSGLLKILWSWNLKFFILALYSQFPFYCFLCVFVLFFYFPIMQHTQQLS